MAEREAVIEGLRGRVRDLEWEVRELKEAQASGGQVEKIVQRAKEVKEVSRIAITDSFTSVESIVKESKKGTIYAGDWEHKQILVLIEGES